MSRRPSITQADIARALKGALAAGFEVGRIELNPLLGTIVIVPGPVPVGGHDLNRLAPEAEGEEGRASRNDFDE